MWSLATRLPKRFVMPLSSSFTGASLPWRARPGHMPSAHTGLDGALGGCLDRPANNALFHLRKLGLQGRRHLAGEIVVRGKGNPAVRERADVVAALECAGRRRTDRGPDRGLDALLDAGDEVLAVLLRADAPVGVDPHHVHVLAGLVCLLYGLGRAETDVARDREDDVGALRDEGVRQGLALGLVGEVAGEVAVLGRLVPAENLHMLAVLAVVVLDTVVEA